MVTGEFYTKKDLFRGFGRPFVYYANILQKCVTYILTTYLFFIFLMKDGDISLRILICRVGRNSEAKDAARVALKSPWWTLGCPYEAWQKFFFIFLVFGCAEF